MDKFSDPIWKTRTKLCRSWGPPSLLCNGCRVSFAGRNRPGRVVDHPPPSSAEVKERVEIYIYSPSGPSWAVLGRTLHLLYLLQYQLTHRCLLTLRYQHNDRNYETRTGMTGCPKTQFSLTSITGLSGYKINVLRFGPGTPAYKYDVWSSLRNLYLCSWK